MRLISIDELQPGMRLARAIFREDDGRVLLHPNIELKSSYVDRIKELKYHHIYIMDPRLPSSEVIVETIEEETRFKARGLLRKTAEQLVKGEAVSTNKLKDIVSELVNQVFSNLNIIYNAVDIRSYDYYLYAHSVNVCIITLMIGMNMGFNRKEMENLGIGALLHDIGRVLMDPKHLDQSSQYELSNYDEVKKHTRIGYEVLKNKFEINFLAAHVALQHHEREDGSGYPRGLTSKRIHRFAKIVAVADAYDAMTAKRSQGVSSHLAIKEIKAMANVKYDRNVIEGFSKIMAPYLLGTTLLLKNGDQVLVTNVTRNECQVMVIKGSQEGQTLNLYLNPNLTVEKVLYFG